MAKGSKAKASSQRKESKVKTTSQEKESQAKAPSQENELEAKTPSQEKESNAKAPSQEKESNAKAPSQEKESNAKAPSQEKESNAKAPSQEKESKAKTHSEEKESNVKTPSQEKESNAKTPSQEKESRAKTRSQKIESSAKTRSQVKESSAKTRSQVKESSAKTPSQGKELKAKTKPGKKDGVFYTLEGTGEIVEAGDSVLLRASDSDERPFVARINKVKEDREKNVWVQVQWYYRPEDSVGGRRQFHGAKELFLSDHFEVQSAHTIIGKCNVHSLEAYTESVNLGPDDYFCRFDYKAATGGFHTETVSVYCKCKMPYNPDKLMVRCEKCNEWFHPSCVGVTIEDPEKLDHFFCSNCSSISDAKQSLESVLLSPSRDI